MGTGVIWAALAFAVVRKLPLGFLATTAIIGGAAVLGTAAAAVHGAHAGLGHVPQILAGVVGLAVAGMIVLIWWQLAGRRRRKHGSAAIASTRYVLYVSPEIEARQKRRKGQRPAK